jgi:hypothetical protein
MAAASLHQAVILVTHGNAFLAGDTQAARGLENEIPFKFTTLPVSFTIGRDWTKVAAPNIQAWFEMLRDQKCSSLRLAFLNPSGDEKPYDRLAFANSETWAIEAQLGDLRLYFHPNMEVVQPSEPSGKVWRYGFAGFNPPSMNLQPAASLDQARSELQTALSSILEFVDSSKLDNWKPWFETGLRQLTSATPLLVDYSGGLDPARAFDFSGDFPNHGYSLDARQIFGCAASSYAFGGMGSWNDQGFPEPEMNSRYHKLTRDLYIAIIDGIAAAANSFST